jgi:hypothetical protein
VEKSTLSVTLAQVLIFSAGALAAGFSSPTAASSEDTIYVRAAARTHLLLEDVSVLLLEDVGDEHGLHDLLGVVGVPVTQHALH